MYTHVNKCINYKKIKNEIALQTNIIYKIFNKVNITLNVKKKTKLTLCCHRVLALMELLKFYLECPRASEKKNDPRIQTNIFKYKKGRK
jgi:hypothetical protein